jgi:hypothetical protein
MSQIIADHCDINTALQKRSGATVSRGVRSDVSAMKGGYFACGSIRVLAQDIGDPVTTERLALPITEEQIARTSVTDRGQ